MHSREKAVGGGSLNMLSDLLLVSWGQPSCQEGEGIYLSAGYGVLFTFDFFCTRVYVGVIKSGTGYRLINRIKNFNYY